MDRDAILQLLLKHLCYNVDGLEEVEIDPSKSMMDYGASSLDIVEVVSSSMRELRIKLTNADLSKVSNIGELVDLFMKAKSAQLAGQQH